MPKLKRLRFLLGLTIALMFSAIFGLSYFYDGSSISKYLTTQAELERANEVDVANYSDQVLFGDELESVPENVDLSESATSDEGAAATKKIREIDDILILVLMLLAWILLIPAIQKKRWLSHIYLVLGIYVITLSIFKGINGGSMFSELAVPAHASRWLPCIVMWMWLFLDVNDRDKLLKIVIYPLIITASLTFVVHGYEAFNEHPKFQDLMYGAFETFSIPLSESICILLLKLIGIKDVCLAVAVLFSVSHWRWILKWMAFWGFLTALARPIAFGDVSCLDALLRVGNGVVPLLIFLLLKHFTLLQRKNDEVS